MTAAEAVRAAFEADRGFLWGLCYRMTGSAADADDLVQESFVRALQHPPRDLDEPLRPWLVRVATNLSLDHLRRRRRAPYAGQWLPSPVELPEVGAPATRPEPEPSVDAGARYDLVEAASYAFLVALEALTPKQRAVLLLRDVFDDTVAECARTLGISEADVRTTHHRARRAMAAYDAARRRPGPALAQRTRHALEEFMRLLSAGDAAGLDALLARDVHAVGDGGGLYAAGLKPILGPAAVARLFLSVMSRTAGLVTSTTIRVVNGLPALVVEGENRPPLMAPRVVLLADVDDDGRITAIRSVMAPAKLTHVRS